MIQDWDGAVTGIVCGGAACPKHADGPLDDCIACTAAFWERAFAHIDVSKPPGPDAIVLHMDPPGGAP